MSVSLTNMPASDKAGAVDLDDIRRYEETPIRERISEQSVYELVCNAAETWDDAPFLKFLAHGLAEDSPSILSFRDAKEQVTKVANAFKELGVERTDAVGFLAPNLPESFICLLAASTAGKANPVNPLLSVDHIASIMLAARVKVIVTVSTQFAPDITEKAKAVVGQLPGDVSLVTLDASEEGAIHLTDLIESVNGDKLIGIVPPCLNDIAGAFHTGGTTSAPKLVEMTHFNQLATTCMGLLGSGYEAGDVSLGGLPSYHVIAGVATPLVALASGVTVLLCGPFGFRNPFMIAEFWKIIEKHRVTDVPLVPTVLSVLKDMPINADISTLRQFSSGAAPLPIALIESVVEKTGAEIVEAFGMTEASTFCARNPAAGEKRAGSVGPLVPYQRARIVENHETPPYKDVAQGKVGKILLGGPNIVSSTAFVDENGNVTGEERVDSEGWLDTGDLGHLDQDGYVWLQGRAKDLIIRSGHNIDPRLIEEVLSAHPAVNLSAAVGQPDSYAGEIPVAYVTLRPEMLVSEEDLLSFVKNQISERPAAPYRVEILEEMPLTAIGKIYKPKLRVLAAEKVALEILNTEVPPNGTIKAQVYESAPGAKRLIDIGVDGLSSEDLKTFTMKIEKQFKAMNFEPNMMTEAQ